jgi:hypothetical protein
MSDTTINAFSQQDADDFLEEIKNTNVSNDHILVTFNAIPESFPTHGKYNEILSAIQAHRPTIYLSLVDSQ